MYSKYLDVPLLYMRFGNTRYDTYDTGLVPIITYR